MINELGRAFGGKRFLEISTPTTGKQFAEIDRSIFETCDRLLYNAPDDFNDNQPDTIRTPAPESYDVVQTMLSRRNVPKYDLVFVDPHHSYRCSTLDILGAACLLGPAGIMVVHDCNPPTRELAQPDFRRNEWCGLTYEAFIDYCCSAKTSAFFTVDCDYGCGVVFRNAKNVPREFDVTSGRDRLALSWFGAKSNDHRRYSFFDRMRSKLLNLISTDRFLEIVHAPRDQPRGKEVARAT